MAREERPPVDGGLEGREEEEGEELDAPGKEERGEIEEQGSVYYIPLLTRIIIGSGGDQ